MHSTAGGQAIVVTRSEAQSPRQGPAENFTGSVRVEQQFQASAPGRASGARVTFEPGARTAWHSHPLGQTLLVTSGVGRVQRWGDPVDEIRPGDVVWIPAGQKHWHGASPTTAMSHIAIGESLDGKSVDWMEQVTDEQYGAALRPRPAAAAAAAAPADQPTRAQQIMGDFAPKLAQLTDDVLFGDVWARPQLSPRDRSLVTISALIAMNRPDQLRSHLARARDNGVTEERGRRDDHAPGLLRGLAERGHGGDGGEGSLREEVVGRKSTAMLQSWSGSSKRSEACA